MRIRSSDGFQRMGLQVGEIRFFPGFLDAGEGELHAADVRQHLEAILAEPIAESRATPYKSGSPLAD